MKGNQMQMTPNKQGFQQQMSPSSSQNKQKKQRANQSNQAILDDAQTQSIMPQLSPKSGKSQKNQEVNKRMSGETQQWKESMSSSKNQNQEQNKQKLILQSQSKTSSSPQRTQEKDFQIKQSTEEQQEQQQQQESNQQQFTSQIITEENKLLQTEEKERQVNSFNQLSPISKETEPKKLKDETEKKRMSSYRKEVISPQVMEKTKKKNRMNFSNSKEESKDQQDNLINIKLKQRNEEGMAINVDSASLEIWKEYQLEKENKLESQSIKYSDLADELDYTFDLSYAKRICSPQARNREKIIQTQVNKKDQRNNNSHQKQQQQLQQQEQQTNKNGNSTARKNQNKMLSPDQKGQEKMKSSSNQKQQQSGSSMQKNQKKGGEQVLGNQQKQKRMQNDKNLIELGGFQMNQGFVNISDIEATPISVKNQLKMDSSQSGFSLIQGSQQSRRTEVMASPIGSPLESNNRKFQFDSIKKGEREHKKNEEKPLSQREKSKSQRNQNSAKQKNQKNSAATQQKEGKVDPFEEEGGEDQLRKSQKKLNQQECNQIYQRLVLYETRKQKAILMMQEAKKKEAELEEIKTIHQKKMTQKELNQAYKRLNQEALKRKNDKIKKQQDDLIRQEEELKQMFKPKINKKHMVNREQVYYQGNLLQQREQPVDLNNSPMTLEKKLEIYQKDAEMRCQGGSQRSVHQ